MGAYARGGLGLPAEATSRFLTENRNSSGDGICCTGTPLTSVTLASPALTAATGSAGEFFEHAWVNYSTRDSRPLGYNSHNVSNEWIAPNLRRDCKRAVCWAMSSCRRIREPEPGHHAQRLFPPCTGRHPHRRLASVSLRCV